MIVFDQLADARITNVSFDREGRSVEFLFLNLAAHTQWKLTASGLVEMIGWDVRRSNIIDKVTVYSGDECAEVEVLKLVRAAWKGNGEDDSSGDDKSTAALKDQLVAGKFSLVSFDAAFGAEFLIVAENVALVTL